MPYVTSPYAPAARRRAANLVLRHGLSAAQAARQTGVHRSTIGKWVAKARLMNSNQGIPTLSSRPLRSAGCISLEVVSRIVELRREHRRCAPVIHAHLIREGFTVSAKTVQRTIRRRGLARSLSKWRRAWTPPVQRPRVDRPGDLVQMDTVHLMRPDSSRYYLFTVIDLHSRWAYAEYRAKLSQRESFAVLMAAQEAAGFQFKIVQTDHGPEFKHWFHRMLQSRGLTLRHSRVRRPNDNAHIERFNRTIQEECLKRYRVKELETADAVSSFIKYYNGERLHMGIQLATPDEIVAKVLT